MKFGDVVKYKDEEYVYLAGTTEIIYLAKIPNEVLSKLMINLRRKVFTMGSKGMAYTQAKTSWCFIELSTEKFKDRIAHYGHSGIDYSPEDFMDVINVLDVKDQKELKQEIMNDVAVSKELRRLVCDINVKEI